MGFKRTPEGRVFFQGVDSANDEQSAPKPRKQSNPSPQMRSPMTGEKTQGQIITLLKTLNERLKATQNDRDNILKELEKTRSTVKNLEAKALDNEDLARGLARDLEDRFEEKIAGSPAGNSQKLEETQKLTKETVKELEETRRALVALERAQSKQGRALAEHNKALSDKVTKTTSDFSAMRKRLESTEAKQMLIDERIEAALTQQTKIMRKVDKAIEDRARFMRKIERIEETVIQTRDSLNAKAMVLLTEQGVAATENTGDIPEHLMDKIEDAQTLRDTNHEQDAASIKASRKAYQNQSNIKDKAAVAWWKDSSFYTLTAGVLAFLLGALVIGMLALNNWQLPRDQPQVISQTSRDSNSQESLERFSQAISNEGTVQRQDALPPLGDPQPIAELNWNTQETASAAVEDAQLASITPQETIVQTAEETQAQPKPVQETASVSNDLPTVDLSNQEQVEALIETDPQAVARALNEIEPQRPSPATRQPADRIVQQENSPVNTKQPNPSQATIIADQIKPDSNLPNIIKPIEKQAFEGIAEAQHDLAAIYTAGHGGVKQNYERAAFWFEKASENGVANASYNLGVMFHQGLGMESSIDQAMKWYKKAAERGHPEAQYNLGIAYIEGIGVPYDPVVASNYFESAANSGVMEAAYNLGLIYENGLVGNAQPQNALVWYKTAADQGSPEAKQALQDLAQTLNIDIKDINSAVDSMRGSAAPSAMPTGEQSNAIPQPSYTTTASAAGGIYAQTGSSTPASQEPQALSYESASAASGTSEQALIAQIQEFLMREGLYPGPADGISGALTQDAIRSYQSQNGLSANGEPTQALLGHMLSNTAN